MPTKPSLTAFRSWFGLVNQVAHFLTPAPLMEPFRELLKRPSGTSEYWDSQLQAIFEATREAIGKLASEGLRYYGVTRPIAVFTGCSRLGISVLVMQQYCECVTQESPPLLQGRVETGLVRQPLLDSRGNELHTRRWKEKL